MNTAQAVFYSDELEPYFFKQLVPLHMDPRLSWGAKALRGYLIYRTKFHPAGWKASHARLARDHSVSVDTVSRWLIELHRFGLVEIIPGTNGAMSSYRLFSAERVYGPMAQWGMKHFDRFAERLKRDRGSKAGQQIWNQLFENPLQAPSVAELEVSETDRKNAPPHDNNVRKVQATCTPTTSKNAPGFESTSSKNAPGLSPTTRKFAGHIENSIQENSNPENVFLSEAQNAPSDDTKSSGGITIQSPSSPKLEPEEIEDSHPLVTKTSDPPPAFAHPMAAFARRRDDATDLVSAAKASAKAQREAEKQARRDAKQQEKAARMQDLMEGRVTTPPPGLTGVDLEEWRRKPGRIYEHYRVAMMKAGHDVAPAGSMAILGMVAHYVGQFEKVDQAIEVLTWSIKNWATVRQKETWIKDDVPTWNLLSSDNVLPKLRNMAKSTTTSLKNLVIGGSR